MDDRARGDRSIRVGASGVMAVREALDRAGALADERLTETEAQHLLADELATLGYPASFIGLPDSDHERLSETALTRLANALISRSKVASVE